MVLDMTKVREKGGNISSIMHNGKVRAVVTVAADGFEKLVAYHCEKSGKWAWVQKNFRK